MRARGTGSIYKPKGKRFLRAVFWVNGRRYNETTGVEEHALAEAYIAARVQHLTSTTDEPEVVQDRPLAEAMRLVIDKPDGDHYWRQHPDGPVLARFLRFVGEAAMAKDATEELYRYMFARMAGEKVLGNGSQPLPAVEASTVRLELEIIRRVFRKLWARGLVVVSALNVKVPETTPPAEAVMHESSPPEAPRHGL